MSDEQKVLRALLNNGSLDNEEQKVRGVAQLAVDKGYHHLSDAQKGLITPWLTSAHPETNKQLIFGNISEEG